MNRIRGSNQSPRYNRVPLPDEHRAFEVVYRFVPVLHPPAFPHPTISCSDREVEHRSALAKKCSPDTTFAFRGAPAIRTDLDCGRHSAPWPSVSSSRRRPSHAMYQNVCILVRRSLLLSIAASLPATIQMQRYEVLAVATLHLAAYPRIRRRACLARSTGQGGCF